MFPETYLLVDWPKQRIFDFRADSNAMPAAEVRESVSLGVCNYFNRITARNM